MARKSNSTHDFADLVRRLNEMSNMTPEQERQELLEAAKKEPRVLDDRQITLADIARLAGIKEFREPTKISAKAEKLIESITSDKSDITKAIEESDKKMPKKAIKEAKKKTNRLEKIAELEAKLAELKAEQKEEQTYDAKTFREVVQKDVQEYIKSCDESALVELYNSISENEATYNEESSNILVKTEETKEIIADAEKQEEKVIAEKEKAAEDSAGMDPNKNPQAQDYAEKPDEEDEEKEKDEAPKNEKEQSNQMILGPDEKDMIMVIKPGSEEGVIKIPKKAWPEHEKQGYIQAEDTEATGEASGFQGQAEARQFDVRLDGDFDRERPTSDNDADAVKNALQNAGIQAEVRPSEADFSSVSINTMAQPDAVIKALGDMVEETKEYTDELSEAKKK